MDDSETKQQAAGADICTDPLGRVSLDLDDPSVQWYGALYYWATHGGDARSIATLLRAGTPVPEFAARFLAAILDSSVTPFGAAGGGATFARQQRTAWRNFKIREEYPLLVAYLKATGRYGRGLHRSAAGDALAELAQIHGLKAAGAVRSIVQKRPAPSSLTERFESLIRQVNEN